MKGAKCLLASAAALLILSGCGKSNEAELARIAGIEATVADLKASNDKLSSDLKQQQALQAQSAAQAGKLDAALKDALAAAQQRESSLRKALEANAAATDAGAAAVAAQKTEIARLKEQLAEQGTRMADTVKAREFQLLDADGRPRVDLHFVETPGANDRPALEFFDRAGENVASYNPEGVFLTQNVNGNHERTSFWTGGVSITRNSRNLRLCMTEKSSFINFDDRAALMATETGAEMTLSDGSGARRAAVTLSNRDGASVTLFDAKMKPRMALDACRSAATVEPADLLPSVRVSDADGKLRIVLGAGSWTGATGAADAPDYSLSLFGRDGGAVYKAP